MVKLRKNICCCLSQSLFNWSSHFFTSFRKPAGNPTDSFKYYTAAIMSFNSYPNIWQKVKLGQYCLQIFNLKQFISLKMGGEVVILANSLISHFQQSLRHSAMANCHFSPVYIDLCLFICLLKLLWTEQAKSHWLHLFDFSLCVFKCVLRWLA